MMMMMIMTQQQALRDEILNTPGVNIVTGWETSEIDHQYINNAKR
eukprot:UN09349